jgi:hypothetical protein
MARAANQFAARVVSARDSGVLPAIPSLQLNAPPGSSVRRRLSFDVSHVTRYILQ